MKRRTGRPRRQQEITNEQLVAMSPVAILQALEAGTLELPRLRDVEGLEPLPAGMHYLDLRGLSFRQFMAVNGEDRPDPSWPAEDVVAWFLDEGAPPE